MRLYVPLCAPKPGVAIHATMGTQAGRTSTSHRQRYRPPLGSRTLIAVAMGASAPHLHPYGSHSAPIWQPQCTHAHRPGQAACQCTGGVGDACLHLPRCSLYLHAAYRGAHRDVCAAEGGSHQGGGGVMRANDCAHSSSWRDESLAPATASSPQRASTCDTHSMYTHTVCTHTTEHGKVLLRYRTQTPDMRYTDS